MINSYAYETTLHLQLWDVGTEHEVVASFTFQVLPGCAASDDGPAEWPGAEIERMTLRLANSVVPLPVPGWLEDMLCDDEALLQELLASAIETDRYNADEAADARREERL